MTFLPRSSGLFGFLLILGAVAPSGALAASAAVDDNAPQTQASSAAAPVADDSVEARLRRISAALHERDQAASGDSAEAGGRRAVDGKLAWVFLNGPGFRNGFRNGWPNGFRNGGFYVDGFRNGGFRNGGFRNYW